MLYKNPEAIPALTSEMIEFRLKPSLEDASLPPLALKVHDTEDINDQDDMHTDRDNFCCDTSTDGINDLG